jgi:intergrase/recombinase
MLTKNEFKEFRKIIREEIEAESENMTNELQTEMKVNMMRTIGELKELNTRIKNVEVKLNKIQKDVRYTVDFLDKEGLKTQKRVERLENHLHLSPLS